MKIERTWIERQREKMRRWNWRLNARYPGHWRMSDREIRKELRKMSWRRAK